MIDHIAPLLTGGAPMLSIALDVDVAEGDIAAQLTTLQAEFEAVEIGIYPRYTLGKLSSHIVLRCQNEALLNQAHSALLALLAPWTDKA